VPFPYVWGDALDELEHCGSGGGCLTAGCIKRLDCTVDLCAGGYFSGPLGMGAK
jgi:hypothetical protein